VCEQKPGVYGGAGGSGGWAGGAGGEGGGVQKSHVAQDGCTLVPPHSSAQVYSLHPVEAGVDPTTASVSSGSGGTGQGGKAKRRARRRGIEVGYAQSWHSARARWSSVAPRRSNQRCRIFMYKCDVQSREGCGRPADGDDGRSRAVR